MRSDRGWASAELALLTPAVLFLAFVLGAVVNVAGDRAQLVLAVHDAVLGAMRGESDASVRAAAELPVSSLRIAAVDVRRTSVGSIETVTVCVTAMRGLPPPLGAMSMKWRECATAMAEP